MDSFFQDIRYGLRMLIKNPGFTLVAVLTLALAIGANTAIFSVVNALILKSLPVNEPGTLVVLGDPTRVHSRSHGTPRTDTFSYPLFKFLREQNTVMSGMFASGDARRIRMTADPTGKSQDKSLRGRMVTGEYFSLLGVQPALGRFFGPQEADLSNPSSLVVISHAFWSRYLGADPSVVGKTVHLNNIPVTIIGVAQPGFEGEISGEAQDLWLPLSIQPLIQPGKAWTEDPQTSWLQVMGRLKPGITISQAHASINVLYKQLVNGPYGATIRKDDRDTISKQTIDLQPGGRGYSWARPQFGRPMMLLLGIVGMVLLIACTNVSNMLLARSSARRKEIALRLAIGAPPKRIVRQLLTESILLAMLGGLVGLLIAQWGTSLLLRWVTKEFSRLALDTSPDIRVLGFTGLLCLVTGIIFGLVPAIRALRTEVSPTLEPGSRMSAASGRGRILTPGNLLVTGQLAVSLLVLFAAGLLVRTLNNLRDVDLGYPKNHLIIVRTDPLAVGYDTVRLQNLSTQLVDAVATIPGVQSASVSKNGLFSGSDSSTDIQIQGFTPANDEDKGATFDDVGPNYFETVGIPIIRGRTITAQDNATKAHVAVINETMAKHFFNGRDPIGEKIVIEGDEYKDTPPYEIVGIARDVRDHDLREKIDRRFYIPLTQPVSHLPVINLEVRTAADPSTVTDAVRARIRSVDQALPITDVSTITDLTYNSVFAESMLARLAGLFGFVALILAAVGIYGLMSYLVVSRTKEIGIRMALGAQRSQILLSILRHSLLLTGIGVVIGVPIALAGTQAMKAILYGVGFVDPLSLISAVGLLGLVAILAGFIPARTATKVDPMIALRYE